MPTAVELLPDPIPEEPDKAIDTIPDMQIGASNDKLQKLQNMFTAGEHIRFGG